VDFKELHCQVFWYCSPNHLELKQCIFFISFVDISVVELISELKFDLYGQSTLLITLFFFVKNMVYRLFSCFLFILDIEFYVNELTIRDARVEIH